MFLQVPHELRPLVHLAGRRVGHAGLARALVDLLDLREHLVELVVVPLDGAVDEHRLRELVVQLVRVLVAVHREDRLELLLLALLGLVEDAAWRTSHALRAMFWR